MLIVLIIGGLFLLLEWLVPHDILYIVADILIKWWLHIDPSHVMIIFVVFYIIIMSCIAAISILEYYSGIEA